MGTRVVVQCVSCGGVYLPLQADGTEYFHACPPQKLVTGAVVDPVTGKVTTPAQFAPIANPRDENVRVLADGSVTVKKGDPAGFTVTTDPATVATFGATGGSV